ncbi:MAG: dTMP kinase [Liquorilactobacillus ghanensis]|uniref:dTMP kinase n=1 Tax=Liquorilactobacillus ghanensis TaxID=399370 RepID=UPI0039EC8F37
MKGKFVTFEGLDGSGKTSVLNRLENYLQQKTSANYLLTREPGGNQIAEQIRRLLLGAGSLKMDARTEALLYAAARRQHLVETVLPALTVGKFVLCDRYVDSSIAYQGAGRQLGETEIARLNEFATDGLQPDLTVYFDVPPTVGLERINLHRSNQINRLDQESKDFYQRVRKSYLRLATDFPKRFVTIDATAELTEVSRQTLELLQSRLPLLFKA